MREACGGVAGPLQDVGGCAKPEDADLHEPGRGGDGCAFGMPAPVGEGAAGEITFPAGRVAAIPLMPRLRLYEAEAGSAR